MVLAVAAVVAAVAAPASATLRTWDDGAGTHQWFTTTNWNPDGAPASSDELRITLAGATVQTASAVTIGGGGSVLLDASGATVSLTQYLYIGSPGTGTLTLDNGALTTASVYLAPAAGSTGVAALSGSTSTWSTGTSSLYIGSAGTGTLTVDQGADLTTGQVTVGNIAGASGSLSLAANGSTWTADAANAVYVGSSGTGTVSVSSAAEATTGTVYLGFGESGMGTATIDGSGSTWSAGAYPFTVGYYGQGTLTITGGGGVLSRSGYVGTMDTAQGTVTVDGYGSEWNVDDPSLSSTLRVGATGTATLTIRNRGRVYVDGALEIGPRGTVNLSTGGELEVDTLAGTIAGTGRLNFTGGTLRLTAGSVTIAADQPLGSSVTLNTGDLLNANTGLSVGSGATLRVSGGQAQTSAFTNNGSLYVSSGGTVIASAGLTNSAYMNMTSGSTCGSWTAIRRCMAIRSTS